MSVKDKILAELRNRIPLAEIRRNYSSKSQTYEALLQFLDEMGKETTDMQTAIETLEQERTVTKRKLESVKAQKENALREVEQLQRTGDRLSAEVTEKNEELTRIDNRMSELKTKGVTLEILDKLRAIECKSEQDLWKRVATDQQHHQAKKDVSTLRRKKSALRKDVDSLAATKSQLGERIASQQNALDQMRLESAAYREAIAVVRTLFGDGYSTDDMKSLQHGLNAIGIKGDSLLSIARLVNGLRKERSLVKLDDKIAGKKNELEMLNKAIANAETKLKVANDLELKSAEEARNTASREINNIVGLAKEATNDMATVIQTHVAQSLSKFDAYVERTMGEINTGLEKWSEIEQQRKQLEQYLEPGQALLGMLQSKDHLTKVPLSMVVRVLEKLGQWAAIYLKNVEIKPSDDIHRKEYHLQTWDDYSVQVLIEFMVEGLTNVMTAQST